MRMICIECNKAQTNQHWAAYNAHCQGCRVRALAKSFSHHESQKLQRITPSYRSALGAIFGADWQAGHELVKAEAKRLKEMT